MQSSRFALRLFAAVFICSLLAIGVLPIATTRTSAQSTAFTGFNGVSAGATLSGRVNIEALVSGSPSEVIFRLSGPAGRSYIDRTAPFFFNGDNQGTPRGWDTALFPDGSYTLEATLRDAQGNTQVSQVPFIIANTVGAAQAPDAQLAAAQATTQSVYTDSLAAGWVNWSWDTNINQASTTVVRSGKSLGVTYQAAWAGFYLSHNGLDVRTITSLTFSIHGGGHANRQIVLSLRDANGGWTRGPALTIPANAWSEVSVPLGASFPTGKLTGITWQEYGGGSQPTFYLDDIRFVLGGTAPSPTVQPTATVRPTNQPTSQPTVAPTGTTAPKPGNSFLETFNGAPTKPQAWDPANWDVVVHSRDVNTWYQLESMQASHGADCAGPPATHPITNYEDAVFLCRDHIMTALKASGYGLIYLTPNQMVDFSNGTATIRFDLSTMRTTSRDWVDVWITPYQENLQLPFDDMAVDLSGPPRNAIQIKMDSARSAFRAYLYKDFKPTVIGSDQAWPSYDTFLTPDPARRDVFEIQISKTRIRMGMPAYNVWWVDAPISSLGWSQGVVQFGHHSYNPLKDCSTCAPNTWHWDNIQISPTVPFTMIKADRRYADRAASVVNFAQPAPAGASLRFGGIGPNLQVSFDGGKTWVAAQTQAQDTTYFKDEHFRSYWMSVPAGTRQIQFRGDKWWGADWHVRDMVIWAR